MLSCSVKTLISEIDLLPLKLISNQSGNTPLVASAQPPPLPQFVPRRSPLLAPLAAKLLCTVEEAIALPPFTGSAKLVCVGPPAGSPQASTSVRRLKPLSCAAWVSTLIRDVTIGLKVICRHTLLFPVMLPPGTVSQLLPFQYWT